MIEVGSRLGNARKPGALEGYIGAVSNSTTTFTDIDRLFQSDNYWEGGFGLFIDGDANSVVNRWVGVPTNSNIQPRILAYTRSTGVEFMSDVPTTMVAGDRYQLYKLDPQRILSAINHALTSAYPDVREDVVDETITIQSPVYAYTVPTTMSQVRMVEFQWDTSIATYPYDKVPHDMWENRISRPAGGGYQVIQFNFHPPTVGNIIRLVGTAPWGRLANLTDTLPYERDSSEMDIIVTDAVKRLFDENLAGAGYLSTKEIALLADRAERAHDKVRARHGSFRQPIQKRSPRVRPIIRGM